MTAAITPELEAELTKIRPHVSSRLPHQKTPATLLAALESTFTEQGTPPTPVAYFAALVTTLEQTTQKEASNGSLDLDEGAILPAILYLLALVLPTVPSPVKRSNLTTILPILAQVIPSLQPHAPPLRSMISIIAGLIKALDPNQLSTPQLRQCFASLLGWSLDQRPKVRKRAQEALFEILSSPPAPLIKHPYLEQTADYIMGVLQAVQTGSIKSKGADGSAEVGIWCCALVKSISGLWPESHLSPLLTSILSLPRFSSPYLTSQSFALLTSLLSTPTLMPTPTHLPTILSTLSSSPPAPSAPVVAQSWLEAIENTMVAFARADPAGCSMELLSTWNLVWNWLKVDSVPVRAQAESSLCAMARYCVTQAIISESTAAHKANEKKVYNKSILGGIITQFAASIGSITFARATPSLLKILTSLISRLRFRPPPSKTELAYGSRPPTAAEVLLPDLIKVVGDMRLAKQFEHRERADEVLGMAVEVIGPKVFLELQPLNILPSDLQKSGDEGRAFLLPILGAHITNTNLGHFVDYFVPLSEKLFELRSEAEAKNKGVEAKLWEACIDQIWACLKGYCEAPVDLSTAFSTPFAQLLTRLLYGQPNLRPAILRAFQSLLRSTMSLASSSTPSEEMFQSFGIDQPTAQKHVQFVKSITGNMLSVLFNVFSSVPTESRGMVGEVITSWLTVAEPKEVDATYNKMITMLKQALYGNSPKATSTIPVSHTMMDLLIIIIPFLSPLSALNLFNMVVSPEMPLLDSADQAIQKRAYRILGRLVESGKVAQRWKDEPEALEIVLKRVEDGTEAVSAGSKRDRLHLLSLLVSELPPSSLHHISLLLPEAILATKEVGEKARNEGFELIVSMGKKMQAGGAVRRAELGGMDDDDGGEVKATLEEYFTMVAAGLAGASPHMISATITSIARIIFEFKDAVSESMLNEVTSTLIVFLKSKNREIVKSALGFVKVAIVSLTPSIVRLHMNDLVPALLAWSHDHKNHFKLKVKHIFERMIRRFGWDDVWNAAGNDENIKFLSNIKKRGDRAQKKKAASNAAAPKEGGVADSESDDEPSPRATTGNAFHDVLYGSESDDSEGESQTKMPGAATSNPKREHARLRLDDDNPMDLLHGGASRIATAAVVKHRKPGQDAEYFHTDEATGRMVIDSEDEDGHGSKHTKKGHATPLTRAGVDVYDDDDAKLGGQAYIEQFTSVDGFTRTATGAVKFHKDTKKRRAMELDGDEEMEVDELGVSGATVGPSRVARTKKQKQKQKQPIRLGQEFKSKRAGGDVKRPGQQDPYAYLPLSQIGVGKKRGNKPQISITGRR